MHIKRLINGYVYAALDRLVRLLLTICKRSWQRESNSDRSQKKDVLKNRFFSNYLMLLNCFCGVKSRAKVLVLLQNNFCQSLLLKSLEIRLIYRKLNSRKREKLIKCITQKFFFPQQRSER